MSYEYLPQLTTADNLQPAQTMERTDYDNWRHVHHVHTLSWGQDDDGNEIASAIFMDVERGTYFIRFLKGRDGTKLVDTLEELNTQTWVEVPRKIRAVIERLTST